MSKLVIKFPTRNRPEKFKVIFDLYIKALSRKHEIEFIVSMDEDDSSMNNDSIKAWLDNKKENIKYFYGNSKTKVEACNANMEGISGDVLLLASDDMIPQVMAYDDIIFQSFDKVFPDFLGAIKFWDGYRSKDDHLMTLTVMGFPLYEKFGYIYHPSYNSLYCDDESTQCCIMLKKLAATPTCIIKHEWTPHPFDGLHARNESHPIRLKDWFNFIERKKINFEIDRIKL